MNGDQGHRLRYFRPAAELEGLVSGYHVYVTAPGPGAVHNDVFYPGWCNIRFQLAGDPWRLTIGDRIFDPVPRACLFGATSRAGRSQTTGGVLAGAGLTPLGWHRLTRARAEEFADKVVPLHRLLGEAAGALHAELLALEGDEDGVPAIFDRFLTARLAVPREDEDRVIAIHRLLARDEPVSVADAAAAVGVHQRTFNRMSRATFGFGPKLLLRRARFLRSLMILREPSDEPWARRIGVDYHDHSHFIRDAHEFLGMTPSEFLALSKPMNDRSTVLRREVLGAAAQALADPPP